MFRRILVALDGSPLAEQTVPLASRIARAFASEIILLRVVETRGGSTGRALDSFDWRVDRIEAVDYLERIKRRLGEEGIGVDLDVTSGRASEEIVELAQVRDVDLVVLGSHGWGGVSRFGMAGTAQTVIFGAETSVLVVPALEEPPAGPAFGSVLVPVDGSPHSDWAVFVAAKLARFYGVDLVVLHVVRTPSLMDPQGTERETALLEELVSLNRSAAHRHLAGLKRRIEAPGVALDMRVEVADKVAPVLERQAREMARPLVILSAGGHVPDSDRPYGGITALMLTDSDHPVLALREPNRPVHGRRRWKHSLESEALRRATIPVV